MRNGNKDVVAVIAAYNNEMSVGDIVRPLRERGFPVVVIDDGSSDETESVAREAGAIVISNEKNLGKMTAIRKGFLRAIELGARTVVTLDGDGQHDPDDVDPVLNELSRNGHDIVIGNRLANRKGMPFSRYLTNRAMSILISFLSRHRLHDTQCGLRAIDARVLKKVALKTERFEGETELILEAARNGFKIGQAPIRTIYHVGGKSWIRPIHDTARFLRFIHKYF